MTAKNLLKEWLLQTDHSNLKEGHYFVIEEAMKEYAKLKCEELLKIVAEKAKIETKPKENILNLSMMDDWSYYTIDKNSILNAVDLNEFIK